MFDFEGTGPNEATANVTQIGAILVDDSGPRDDVSFASYVNPGQPIPALIESLTGVTNELVLSAPSFPDVYERFRDFCGEAPLVTQCGYEYDFPLMDNECRSHQLAILPNARLDTKAVFALLHPEKDSTFSTNFLSDYYRIDRTPFRRHDALGDAKLIGRIYWAELLEARKSGIDSLAVKNPVVIKKSKLPPA